MKPELVVDASVVIKWMVQESDSAAAVRLRSNFVPLAPDFLFAECTNILWKKVQRNELTAEEATVAAQLVDRLNIARDVNAWTCRACI